MRRVLIADLHNGLALWVGEVEEQSSRYDRMRRKAKKIHSLDLFDANVVKLSENDIPEDEFEYAVKNMILSRRTIVKLQENK